MNIVKTGILVAATLAAIGRGGYVKVNVNPTNTEPYFDVSATMRERGDDPGACETIITIYGDPVRYVIRDGELVSHDERLDDCRDLSTHYERLPTSMRPGSTRLAGASIGPNGDVTPYENLFGSSAYGSRWTMTSQEYLRYEKSGELPERFRK